tara:strand:- start:208 stop:837 length:630 start_codon:yes stop_codon:yes gene_type:complete
MNLSLVNKYFHPKLILDIGANTGGWFIKAKEAFGGDTTIISVEANIHCKKFLFKNNPYSIIALLSYKEHYQDFFLNSSFLLSTGSSIYKELSEHFSYDNARCLSIKTKTLDRLFAKLSFDLIKLDTQGSELDILKGGIHTLKKAKGCIIEVSHKPYNLGAPLSHEVVNFMLEHKFLLKETLSTHAAVDQSDYLFINEWWLNCYEKITKE